MKYWISSIACLLLLALGHTHAQSRDNKGASSKNRISIVSSVRTYDNVNNLRPSSELFDLEMPTDNGKNFLLLIAVDKYKYWKSLSNAVKDARDVERILTERYGFAKENIFSLINEEATPDNIKATFEALKEKGSGIDNLLIYYSGHGYYDGSFDMGYWVPSEGRLGGLATQSYIDNEDIRNYVKELNFRHVFLIADACFSGSLFMKGESRGEAGEEEEKKRDNRSRWGISSGGLEEVPDGERGKNSPFANLLVSFLRDNLKDRISAQEVCKYVTDNIARYSDQKPQASRLSGMGDEGGQFVFQLQGQTETRGAGSAPTTPAKEEKKEKK